MVMMVLGGWDLLWFVLECIIGLYHESFMAHNLQGIASELYEVVTLEKLFVLRQVRCWILLHNARLAVVRS